MPHLMNSKISGNELGINGQNPINLRDGSENQEEELMDTQSSLHLLGSLNQLCSYLLIKELVLGSY